MPLHLICSAIGLVLTLIAGQATAQTSSISGAARVTDGDTVIVSGTRIRLSGIDAPEMDQTCISNTGKTYACGVAARDALVKMIGNRPLNCSGNETDVYDRRIMTCFAGATDLNARMVADGWALAFRRYSTVYVGHEQSARARQAGMWSGAFVAPWDWRRRDARTEILGALAVPIDAQHRLLPEPIPSEDAATGCRIKGNINRKGTHIYHVPGQRDYERTVITESAGERWFCTEEEARAAGWRRAHN